MKKVILEPINDSVNIKTESSLLQVLLAKELNVLMACQGRGLCATCHVYIKSGHESLTPLTDIEKRRLGGISGVNKTSRLACQVRVLGDGVVVELPEGMYIESLNDIEGLIGRRSEGNIMHPVDGTVLIEKGKLITRTKINSLNEVNFDLGDIRKHSKGV